jgi:hypothetical protein
VPPLAGEIVDADILQEGSYTPVLTAGTTNPTLGVGAVQSGWWKRVDSLIIGGAFIRFGTSGAAAGSGGYFISLPFAADTTFMIGSDGGALGSSIGIGHIRDNSVPTLYVVVCQLAAAANTVRFYRDNTGTNINDATPVVWANNDAFHINFAYQADPTAF